MWRFGGDTTSHEETYHWFMSDQSPCPVCSRPIGLRPSKDGGWTICHHKGPSGVRCPGSGKRKDPTASPVTGETQKMIRPGERLTWGEALEAFEKTAVGRGGRRLSPATLSKYRPRLRYFSSFCKAHGVDCPADLGVEVIRQFHATMVGDFPSSAGAQAVAAVRSFLRWAEELWSGSETWPTASAVARACPTVRVESIHHPSLSRTDFELLASYVEQLMAPVESFALTEVKRLRDGACMVLAAFAGLRRSEVANLSMAGVDTGGSDAVWLLNVLGKGGKRRQVALSRSVAGVIERYLEAAGRRLVFDSDEPLLMPIQGQRRPMSGLSVYAAVHAAQRAAGLSRPVCPHGLRSTFARQFLRRSKGDLPALQHLLGHASPSTTILYGKPLTAEQVAEDLPGL